MESAERVWSELVGEISRSKEGEAAVHLQTFDGAGAGPGDESGQQDGGCTQGMACTGGWIESSETVFHRQSSAI